MILNPKFKEYYLSELCDLITDGTHSTHKEQLNGKPLATIKDMTGNGINFNSCRMISEEDFNRLKTSNCVPIIDDLLFAKDGSMLKEIFVNKQKEFAITSHIALIRTKKEILEPLYLKYYLSNKSIKDDIISNYSSGSVIPSLILKDINKFQISIPNKKIQLEIVEILSSIDDKIELNHKINKTLEELAKTLYKHWFVDFEFPNEEGKPYKSSGGEMVESELGIIPKGWEVKKVSELFVFIGGSQPPKSEHIYEAKDGYVRFLQNRDYRDNSNHLTYIKVAKRNKLAEKYDILMDKYGEVGQIRFGLEGAYNVALAKIEPVDSVDLEYLRGYFSQKSITTYLENSSIASTRGSLNATTFTGLKVPYPSNELRFSFSGIQFKTLELILNFKSQNQQLSTLRDLLLPKLMSGEIEV